MKPGPRKKSTSDRTSHKKSSSLSTVFLAALIFTAAGHLSAQIRIANPSIPPDERIIYLERIDAKQKTLEHRLQLINEGEESYYRFTSVSDETEVVLRLDPVTLFSTYSEIIEKNPGATIRRTNQVIKYSAVPKSDEIVVADLNSLTQTLRGFPWGKVNFAKLKFLGSASSDDTFSFELTITGRETIRAGGKSYETWKVQLGLSGFFGGFIPKTYLWYSVQAPHFLVKSEGSVAGPGSPTRILELQSYTAGNR